MSAKLQDEEAYEQLDRLTRLEVFQAHIRQLEEEEKQHKEREKEAKRRKVGSGVVFRVCVAVGIGMGQIADIHGCGGCRAS